VQPCMADGKIIVSKIALEISFDLIVFLSISFSNFRQGQQSALVLITNRYCSCCPSQVMPREHAPRIGFPIGTLLFEYCKRTFFQSWSCMWLGGVGFGTEFGTDDDPNTRCS
jgi:hypothetical protein